MKTIVATKFAGKTLAGLNAAALALALGAASVTPAHAEHGDVAKGLLLGLAGGVALDQLANQKRRPQATYAPPPEVHRRVVREYVPAPAPVSPLHRAFADQGRRERLAIQYHLMQDGLYDGAIDGVWGPATSQALFTYANQHQHEGMLTTQQGANQLFALILG